MSIAVPLCGFGGGGLPKSKIVNNFTTTEEGYVADARALKTLNDSKLSMELLWTNGSPTSSFVPQDINLDLSGYLYVEIYCKATTSSSTLYCKKTKVGNQAFFDAFTNQSDSYKSKLVFRLVITSKTNIAFSRATTKEIDSTTAVENNSVLIPVYIYGIKGVSA